MICQHVKKKLLHFTVNKHSIVNIDFWFLSTCLFLILFFVFVQRSDVTDLGRNKKKKKKVNKTHTIHKLRYSTKNAVRELKHIFFFFLEIRFQMVLLHHNQYELLR